MKEDHMPGNSPLYTAPKSSSDFWKFWAGQSISTLGSSFTGFALALLIFKLTGSPLDLSFTVAASVLPYLFFGLVIGAWVDRVNRKRLMILTDIARAVAITSIPLASVFGLLSVWWIYAVVFVNSTTCSLFARCVIPGWRQRLSPFYAASVVRGRWRSLWVSPPAAVSRVRARPRVPGEYRWRKQSASDRAVLLAGLPSGPSRSSWVE
ncbi:MAG: MFS transporter [Chloroflexi bacterium]|nr:MAG: MFS transporter [Chloroflexota bacterium]